MAGIHIPESAILTLGDKLTVFIREGRECPFILSKPVDLIIVAEKDYNINQKYINNMMDEKTKILIY